MNKNMYFENNVYFKYSFSHAINTRMYYYYYYCGKDYYNVKEELSVGLQSLTGVFVILLILVIN